MPKVNLKNAPQKQAHLGSGFVRIISGKWRGRKLPIKNVEGLRPTADRVKETVFNWLQKDLYQAHCLDLFAGSGSLGLEALSRHANHVTFIEKDVEAYDQLLENIKVLQIDNALLYHSSALDFLTKTNISTPYDIIFVDPPFHKNLLEDTCNKLNNSGLLSPDALIYIETELSAANLPSTWRRIKEKKAGQVYFFLYQKENRKEK